MTQLLKENEDYALIPLEEHQDAWGVRFITGPFPETVVVFGAIGFNKVKDNLTFNFEIQTSPDPELSEDNQELQEYCAIILEAIIISGIEDGTVELKDPE